MSTITPEQAAALDAARHLAAHGVPLFLAPPALDSAGEWDPTGGKGQTGYWLPEGWDATTADPRALDAWRPGWAVCAVMGHTVDGLDVDPRHEGDATASGWAAAGMMPRSYGSQSTPSGGWHSLIAPLGCGSKDAAASGVDVKGGRPDGTGRGFLFIAPTVRLSKATGELAAYRWTVPPFLDELDPDDDTGAWLAERIRQLRPAAKVRETSPADRAAFDSLDAAGQERVRRYLDAAVKAIRAELTDAAGWPVGRRDDRGRGWQKVTADAAYRLGALARAPWTPWSLGDAWDALRTAVPPAVAASVPPTREWAAQAHRAAPAPFPTTRDRQAEAPAPDAAPGEVASQARQDYGPSQDDHEKDTGKRSAAAVLVDLAHARDWGDTNLRSHQRIAARFATYGRGKVMFVHGAGWHRWDGTRWAPDANNAFTTRLLTELLTLSWSEAITDKDLQSDVRASMTAMGSRGVLELARSHEGLFAEHVDRDPWLLNCLNGTLDLHTMELRPHDPEDRITKVCGAAYRPDATAKTWNYLVESSLPDAAVRGFLQRWAGLSLVGRVIEHVLVILTGDGRNGKGMIAHTIGKALGNADGYASTGAASMLVAGRYGDKPSAGELAAQYRLRGARWVVLSEIQRGARMDEATMKMLTGGDKIQAKRMGLDPVEFAPSHSLTMLANDLPVVDPDAKAVWDRLRVVPFTVDFSGREDKTLEERLESELEGVLAWCVAGLRDYLDRGRHLDEPDAVSARTDAYRDDNDALGRFITEECIEHRAAHVSKADFAAAYAEWAEREREPKFGAKVIAARMGKRPGITERRADSRTREWVGIGLRHEDPESSPEPTPESEIALTRESVTCVTSSRSIPRKTIVGNHREHLTQVTQVTPATPVDQTVAEATPCRLHRDRPHPDACFTCAELAGRGGGTLYTPGDSEGAEHAEKVPNAPSPNLPNLPSSSGGSGSGGSDPEPTESTGPRCADCGEPCRPGHVRCADCHRVVFGGVR